MRSNLLIIHKHELYTDRLIYYYYFFSFYIIYELYSFLEALIDIRVSLTLNLISTNILTIFVLTICIYKSGTTLSPSHIKLETYI